MTKYEFSLTIGASALDLATQAFTGTAGVAYPNGWPNVYGKSTLLANKLSLQLATTATGNAWVGNSSVTNAGANADYQLNPGVSPASGTAVMVDSYTDSNIIDLAQFYVHGSNAGDKVTVSYYQE